MSKVKMSHALPALREEMEMLSRRIRILRDDEIRNTTYLATGEPMRRLLKTRSVSLDVRDYLNFYWFCVLKHYVFRTNRMYACVLMDEIVEECHPFIVLQNDVATWALDIIDEYGFGKDHPDVGIYKLSANLHETVGWMMRNCPWAVKHHPTKVVEYHPLGWTKPGSPKYEKPFNTFKDHSPYEYIPISKKKLILGRILCSEEELNKDFKFQQIHYVYDKHGVANALIRLPDRTNARYRSEVLILWEDKIYLELRKNGTYRIPGGGIDLRETAVDTCIRETKEEARLIIPAAVHYSRIVRHYDEPSKWVQNTIPKKSWWSSEIAEICVGCWDGVSRYTGPVADVDKDAMAIRAKFYPITDVFPTLRECHKVALCKYIHATKRKS